jgi:hypothetical protein
MVSYRVVFLFLPGDGVDVDTKARENGVGRVVEPIN